jgi:hypothetical protein
MDEFQNTKANELQTENIVKRIMTSEVKYLIGVLVFLFGVVAPYYSIKTDIELIKQNHLAHLETMQSQIKDMQVQITDMKRTEIELIKEIAKQGVLINK